MLMRSRREHVPHSRSFEEVLPPDRREAQFLKRRTSLSLDDPKYPAPRGLQVPFPYQAIVNKFSRSSEKRRFWS